MQLQWVNQYKINQTEQQRNQNGISRKKTN